MSSLTYRAPFACLLCATLRVWCSAFVRWAIYRSWAELTRLPIPSQIPAPTATATFTTQSTNTMVTAQLRFAFTVYENQRWWMGLECAVIIGQRRCLIWILRRHGRFGKCVGRKEVMSRSG